MSTPYPLIERYEPRDYQVRGRDALLYGGAKGLWMACGLGKTLTLLLALAAKQAPWPVVVVTSALGRGAWVRDQRHAFPASQAPFGVLWGGQSYSKSGRHRDGTYSSLEALLADGKRGVITSYEVLGKRLEELQNLQARVLVFDESHRVKCGWKPDRRHRDGGIIRNVYNHAKQLSALTRMRGGTVWEATATPTPDRIRDLWAQLETVGLNNQFCGTKWRFTERYCNGRQGQYGWLSDGASHTDELCQKLSEHFFIETREAVADQLPAIQRNIISLPCNGPEQKVFSDFEAARDLAAGRKYRDILDLVANYIGSGLKCVVTFGRREHVTKCYEFLEKRLPKKIPAARREDLHLAAVTGAIPVRRRVEVLEAFNEMDGPGVMIATDESIGQSVDLHYVHGLIVAALPFDPVRIEQLEGRLGRLGGVPATVDYLVAEGTYDDAIYDVLLSKLDAVVAAGTETQGGEGTLATLRDRYDVAQVQEELRSWLREG